MDFQIQMREAVFHHLIVQCLAAAHIRFNATQFHLSNLLKSKVSILIKSMISILINGLRSRLNIVALSLAGTRNISLAGYLTLSSPIEILELTLLFLVATLLIGKLA